MRSRRRRVNISFAYSVAAGGPALAVGTTHRGSLDGPPTFAKLNADCTSNSATAARASGQKRICSRAASGAKNIHSHFAGKKVIILSLDTFDFPVLVFFMFCFVQICLLCKQTLRLKKTHAVKNVLGVSHRYTVYSRWELFEIFLWPKVIIWLPLHSSQTSATNVSSSPAFLFLRFEYNFSKLKVPVAARGVAVHSGNHLVIGV